MPIFEYQCTSCAEKKEHLFKPGEKIPEEIQCLCKGVAMRVPSVCGSTFPQGRMKGTQAYRPGY